MADPKYRLFPESTVAELQTYLTRFPNSRLKLFYVGATPFLQVIPPGMSAADPSTTAAIPDDCPPPLNDSFVCPGSPGCP